MLRLLHHLTAGANLPVAGLIFLLEGIGLPIPVEIPVGILGYRVAHGDLNLMHGVLLMWMMTNLGNLIGYALGYRLGRAPMIRMLRFVHIKPHAWDRLEGWFQVHGLKAVVFTRWINWGFAQNMWLCGITRIPFQRFLPLILINNLLWAMAWTWLSGHLIGLFRRAGWRMLQGLIDHLPWLLLGGAAVGGLVWWVRRRMHGQTHP
jgi:membrane protein DedA with SNARE-associated domain